MFNKFAVVATLAAIATSYLTVIAHPAGDPSGTSLIKRNGDVPTNALATFPGCDVKQTETLRRAIPVAQRYQAEAWQYFNERGQNPPAAHIDMKRYTIWFGAYSPAHYTIVYNRFQQLHTYPLDQWTYQCVDGTDPGCGGRVEQYLTNAYSVQTGLDPNTRIATLGICKGFFSLMRSDDDNGQSIIHEASHFHSNGINGTNTGQVEKDYGTTASLSLAKHHPDQAVQNADNYGYFAQYPGGCGTCHIQ